MSMPTPRKKVLERLQQSLKGGQILVGAGAGIGLSAKCLEEGGADLILVYNSGRFRMAGRGSLAGMMPYSDANAMVVDMAKEILPIIRETPILAGVCGTDPFRSMHLFLRQLRDLGYCGVQNFPTVGLIDGRFRQNLEETGMGYEREVEMIAAAHDLDLVTTPYVFNADEAERMTKAGADVVVAHMGLTTSGSVGASTAVSLDDCVTSIQNIRDAAHRINSNVLVLCHGGPIARPEDARYILEKVSGLHGFFGASSMERLPVETAIAETTRTFKDLRVAS
ncbi:MAG: hypothetical protein Q9207_001322 [Kuettlingeria erythrocarpa]